MPSLFIDRAVTSTAPSFAPLTLKKHVNISRRNNRLLPVFRIYPDLLEYIFTLGANLQTTTRQRQYAIISYSQTCHDWRIIAISLKSLWGGLIDFEVNSEEWNKELLQRSYPSPIVVGSTAYALRPYRVISAELEHFERFRTYRVGFEASAWDILLERLQQPAPHIEYLNINHVGYGTINSFILPSTLFAGDAPRLKRLEMTQCLVNFHAPVLRSLTTLSVQNLNASIAPTPLEWLEHLGRLPLLASLRLVNCMHSQGHSVQESNQVKLPLLSMLVLDASLYDIHVFIDGLKFPVSCGLIVSCSECYPGPELDVILLAYSHRLNYAQHLRLDDCPFFIHARRSRLSIWNDSSDDSHTVEPPTLCLHLNLGNFEFDFWESLLTPVLYILQEAFSSFTSLELQLPATHPALLPCLVRATKLTRLTNLSAIMTKNLLTQMQVVQPSGFIPLPALHTITFSDGESMWGAPYRAFVSYLTWRRTIGYPITRVLYQQCLVLEDIALNLESLGVQVDCDSKGLRWQQL